MSQLGDTQPSDVTTESAIDDAMRTMPLANPPAKLYPAVMARVNAVDALPQFRLGWLDCAIGVLLAAMVGTLVFVWQYLPTLWPSPVASVEQLKTIETLAVAQPLDPIAQWTMLFGVAILFITLVVALVLSWTRPVALKIRS